MADAETNPYAPPTAPIGATAARTPGKPTAAERIRREYLSQETSLRSVGSLHLLVALMGVVFLVIAIATERGRPVSALGYDLEVLLIYLAFVAFHATLGYGMDRLRPWARWVEAVLMGLTLPAGVVGIVKVADPRAVVPTLIMAGLVGLIPAYILYLLFGRKGKYVFSPEYQDVIAQTLYLKSRTSPAAWGCFVIVVAVPAISAVVAALSRLWP